MRYILTGYLILINLIAFFAMLSDKRRAIDGRWRISEAMLFFLAVVGGSVGAILGMYCFRHKTKRWYFVCGMPVILLLQIALAVFLLKGPLNNSIP